MMCWKSSINSERMEAQVEDKQPKYRLIMLTVDGRTQTLRSWCRELGVKYSNAYYRIQQGWSVKAALELEDPPPKQPVKRKPAKEVHRANAPMVTLNGETKPLKEWCKLYGMEYNRAYKRLEYGWSPERALGLIDVEREKTEQTRQAFEGADESSMFALVSAIIMQAANDYRRALIRLSKKPGDKIAQANAKEIESFFRSSYFGSLSDLDPENLIATLQQEVKENKKRPYFSRKAKMNVGIQSGENCPAVRNCTIIYKNIIN